MNTQTNDNSDELCNALLESGWSSIKTNQIIKLIEIQKTNIQFINGQTKRSETTPLMIASRDGHLQIVLQLIPLLLEHKCDINQQDKRGNTALILAAGEGRNDIVKILLENGSNINASDNTHNTALMHAAWDVHIKTVSLLLENGANKHHVNKKGQNALELAQRIVNREKDWHSNTYYLNLSTC